MRWDPDRSWAAAHLVSTVSRKGGGPLPPHKTHHLGIDADIGLFMDDGRQPLGGFVDVPP
jgi:murein endopeptidase